MRFIKKLLIFPLICLISSSVFSCSWEEVTVTPEGQPVPSPEGEYETKTELITSNGTYGLTFSEGLDFYTVSGYHGSEADVFIPAEWNGKPVVGIEHRAFYEKENVETITITSAIKSIEKEAIVGNYKIFCETDASHDCDIEDCDSIHPYGWHVNWYLTSDGKNASADPGAVEWSCGSFGSFSWSCNEKDEIVITGFIEKPKSLTIPEKIGKRTVVAIAKEAFSACSSLEKITLPQTLSVIESFAFRDCTSLKEITLPDSITVISSYLFDGCISLEAVTLSPFTTSIATGAFSDCIKLKELHIPSTVTKIESLAFHNTKGLAVYLSGVEKQDDWFCECCFKSDQIKKETPKK